jgi:hypothetical protein
MDSMERTVLHRAIKIVLAVTDLLAGVRLVVYLDGKERSVMKVIPY